MSRFKNLMDKPAMFGKMTTSCETSESSLSYCDDTYGHLLFYRKGGGPGLPYSLTVGETTIGYSLDADIRIKIQDDRLEEIHCIVEVDESGVAKLTNKSSSNTVLVNDIPIDKFIILHNKDTVDVIGKTFQYINENISDEEIQRFERIMPKFCTPLKKRRTIAPLLSLKSSTPCSDIKTMVSLALSTHNRMRRSSNTALKIMAGKRLSLTDQSKPSSKNLMKNKENFRKSASASIPMEKRKSSSENDCSIKPSLSEITISDVDLSSISNNSPLNIVPGQRRKTSSMSHIFSDFSTEFLSSNSFVVENVTSSSSSVVTSDLITFEDTLPINNGSSPKISHVMKTANESTSASTAGTVEDSMDSTPKLQDSKSLNILGIETVSKMPRETKSPYNDFTNTLGDKSLLRTPREMKSPKNALTNIAGVKKLATPKYTKSPQNDLTDIKGVKKLLRTPRQIKSPINDLTDIKGVKKLSRTPRQIKSPINDLTDIKGVKKLLRTPRQIKSPINDLTNIVGVKKLLATPKPQKSPKNDLTDITGVKSLLATPKYPKSPQNDLSNIVGVKKILKTPRQMKSPKNDLTNVVGVKKLLATPKPQKSPKNDLTYIAGVKRLLSTPKFPKSPKNDLTDIAGVKKLLRTPRHIKSPRNDLTNVGGLKKLLATPKQQKSPKNDLANIIGVKKLLATPKYSKSPQNDLTEIFGVKKLFKTPRQIKSPKNDLTNVDGVKKLFNTRKQQKSPKNDLTEILGVKKLLRTPKEIKSPKNALDDLDGVAQLYEEHNTSKSVLIEDHNDLFDKLLDKKPLKTYRAQSISPLKNIHVNMRRKTMGDVSGVTSPRVANWVEEQKSIIRHQSAEIPVDEVKPVVIVNPVEENIVKTPASKGEKPKKAGPFVHGGRKRKDETEEEEDVSIGNEGEKPEQSKIIRRGRSKNDSSDVKNESETPNFAHIVRRGRKRKEEMEEKDVSIVDDAEKPAKSKIIRRGMSKKETSDDRKESETTNSAQHIVRRGRKRKEETVQKDVSIVDDEEIPENSKTIRRGRSKKEISDGKKESETPNSAQHIVRRGRKRKEETEQEDVSIVDQEVKPEKSKIIQRGMLKKETSDDKKESETTDSAQHIVRRGRKRKGEPEDVPIVDDEEKPEKSKSIRRGRSKKEISDGKNESETPNSAQHIVRRGRKRKEETEQEVVSIVDQEEKPEKSKLIQRGRSNKEISDGEKESETPNSAKPIVRRGRKKKDDEIVVVPNDNEVKDSEKPKTTRRGAAKKHQEEEQVAIKETVEIEVRAGRRTRRNVGGIKEESSDDTIRTRKVKNEFNKYGEDFVHESPLKKKNTRRKN